MTLSITSGSTVPKPNGVDFLTEYAGHLTALYEAGSRPLTAVGGTGNAVTATMAMDLTAAGLVDGLSVTLTWVAANTSNVTLAINGGAAIPVLGIDGSALIAGNLVSGLTSVLRYTGGSWRVLTALVFSDVSLVSDYQVFTASGTWNKPTGPQFNSNSAVRVRMWGGGGGGGRSAGTSAAANGGCGGAFYEFWTNLGYLGATEAVLVGAGGPGGASNGSNGTAGGNSSFAGETAVGGPGGLFSATDNLALRVAPTTTSFYGAVGFWDGGDGGGTPADTPVAGESVTFGGGGGGGDGSNDDGSVGGVSKYGGDGGVSARASNGQVGQPGQIPGGGGGGASISGGGGIAGAGARGEVQVMVFV